MSANRMRPVARRCSLGGEPPNKNAVLKLAQIQIVLHPKRVVANAEVCRLHHSIGCQLLRSDILPLYHCLKYSH